MGFVVPAFRRQSTQATQRLRRQPERELHAIPSPSTTPLRKTKAYHPQRLRRGRVNFGADPISAGKLFRGGGAFQDSARTGALEASLAALMALAVFATAASAQTPVTLAPANLPFGTQFIYTTSAPRTVLLTNNQAVALTISNITTSTDFAQTNNCGNVVAAGTNCTISVTFAPSAVIYRKGFLTVTDDASGSPQQTGLNGIGASPVSLSSNSIQFGNQQIFTASSAQTLTVTNLLSAPLNFSAIQILQSVANFQQSNTCGSSLPGNSTCIITIVFRPQALGSATGALRLTDNTGSGTMYQFISLSGNGAPGPVTLSPTSLSFGSQFLFMSGAPQTVALTNNESVPLNISSIVSSLADFTQDNDCPNTLAAGSSCTITVMFTPNAVGIRRGSVIESDDSATSPQSVAAAGTGISPVWLSTRSIAFGDQAINTTSSTQTVTVTNLLSVPLNFSSIQILQTLSNFQQTNTCGTSIAGNSSCSINIVFQPQALGDLTGSVRLRDNAGSTTMSQFISLAGNGNAGAVLTYHYDNARTGANTSETILTPANVDMNQFGKLFSLPVDAGIVAQPLYVPNLQIPGQGTHNVVYVATQHNSLYAFDADNAGAPLWSVNFGPYVPDPEKCLMPGDAGIIGTPVIDLSSNTIYVVAATLPNSTTRRHELHALDITSGTERPSSPAIITASAHGTGTGSKNGVIGFPEPAENQRPALLLDNGVLYIGFASYCDAGSIVGVRGWLLAYDSSTLKQTNSFVVTPNDVLGGIWASGGGPAADANHNIYFSTGNGTFDFDQGGPDLGDSVLKLTPNGLSILDYFTPQDQAALISGDLDLGSGGVVLLPDQPAAPSHLLVAADKRGRIYLINRDNLGQYNPSGDNVVEELSLLKQIFSTPTFWNNTLYFVASSDYPKAFPFSGGLISTTPSSQAAVQFRGGHGTTTVVSASGQKNGILWAVQHGGTASGNEVLHAYDATNLADELYNSDQAGTRDLPGIASTSNFESIIVANGKVYVPTGQPQLTVFGLLPVH
jgi:hypothetical protein